MNNPTAYEYALRNRTVDNVTMRIKEETVSKTGTTFIVMDKNEASCGYSDEYRIDRKLFGIWVPVIPLSKKKALIDLVKKYLTIM